MQKVRLSKKLFMPLLASLVIITTILSTSTVFAGSFDYTSGNPYLNSNYDRNAAIWYATVYANSVNSTYGECPANDCTNFASQVLKCGSMNYLYNGGTTAPWSYNSTLADSQKSWYFKNLTYPNRSTSWTGAEYFRFHWANVNGVGNRRAYSYKSYTIKDARTYATDIGKMVHAGDIIQYADSNGLTHHSQIVYGTYPDGQLRLVQHSDYGYRWFGDYIKNTSYAYVCVIRIKNT